MARITSASAALAASPARKSEFQGQFRLYTKDVTASLTIGILMIHSELAAVTVPS
jgi:hypothetical protein